MNPTKEKAAAAAAAAATAKMCTVINDDLFLQV